jgi:hypothetical protein
LKNIYYGTTENTSRSKVFSISNIVKAVVSSDDESSDDTEVIKKAKKGFSRIFILEWGVG